MGAPEHDDITLRDLRPDDWAQVADLIHLSTNYWYRASGRPAIFTGDPAACELFPRVYDALDGPGRCVVAVSGRTGQVVGSCFYHPRPTHVSVGIVNAHPAYFGRGIARRMMERVIALAEADGKPVRLVSSAMNLDSFSLYTRLGFVPHAAYQDMYVTVPKAGLGSLDPRVRPATPADAPAMAALEREVSGIEREGDYRYFLANAEGIWHASVLPSAADPARLYGFLVSVAHPASNMLGPGVMRTEADAAALIRAELDQHRGRAPVFLVPVQASSLVAALYVLGAKNCEIHFAQVRGAWTEPRGVVMPTFMPETG
jgi:ribosomal protein S18 acetylase RimI-like enzyme